jgi:hypothetical protein
VLDSSSFFFFIFYLHFENYILRNLQDDFLGTLAEDNVSIRNFAGKLMKKSAYICSGFSLFAFKQSGFFSIAASIAKNNLGFLTYLSIAML